MIMLLILLFSIDQAVSLRCNKGQNFAVKASTCRSGVSFCSTITFDDDTTLRDCDIDGCCNMFSIGRNQCKIEKSGAKIDCCNTDLCNSSPLKPKRGPVNCWSGMPVVFTNSVFSGGRQLWSWEREEVVIF
jgi:hypothetical protein